MSKDSIEVSDSYPHNGKFLQDYIKKNGVNRAELARKLNVSNTTVYQYAESSSLQLSVLWKASLALNHNFVAELSELLPLEHNSKRETELEKRIKVLETELEIKTSIYEKMIEKLNIELSEFKSILAK
jgi:transcriptional regulator with XRE-family HTH domain